MEYEKIIAQRVNKTVYKNGDKTIKVFSKDCSKANIINEVNNQAIIEELGMKTPKVLEMKIENDSWVIVSQYVEGVTLEEMMKGCPDVEDEYLKLFVQLQMKIHSKTTNRLTRLKDKLNEQIKKADVPATVRYDFHMRLETVPRHHKVCHGDFNPSNIIIGNDGELYILDWSHATQGNASGDAAMTYLLFRIEGKDELAEKYLNLFCEKAGIERTTVESWIPMVAASHSVECKDEESKQLMIDIAQGIKA